MKQLAHAVVATEATLRESLFVKRAAEVVIGYAGDEPAGFARVLSDVLDVSRRPGHVAGRHLRRTGFRRQGLGEALLDAPARRSPSSAATDAWNGPCSTGTSWRLASTRSSARARWTSGSLYRLTGIRFKRLGGEPNSPRFRFAWSLKCLRATAAARPRAPPPRGRRPSRCPTAGRPSRRRPIR